MLLLANWPTFIGAPTTKGSRVWPNCNTTVPSRDSCIEEVLATSSYASRSLWTTTIGQKSPLSFQCKKLSSLILELKLLSTYWAFWKQLFKLWVHDPLYLVACYACVMELVPCKLRMDSESSELKQNCNLQDRPKPGPSGLSFLQEGWFPLSLVPFQLPVLEEVTPLADYLAAWDPLSEQQ